MINYVDLILDTSEAGKPNSNVRGSRDNASFTLQPPIENCVGLSVISVDVPFTYFVIDETNRYFSIMEFGLIFYYNITPGTYDNESLALHLNSLGPYANSDNNGTNPGYEMISFVDKTDGKLVFYFENSNTPIMSFMNSGPHQCKIPNNGIASDTGRILGFSQEKTYTSSFIPNLKDNLENDISDKFAVKGDLVVKLTGPRQMFLNSDLGSLCSGNVRNQTDSQSIIGFWPVNSGYQGTIEYFREEPEFIEITRSNIISVRINLGLGNRTLYGTSSQLTNHLQLNGEPFKVGLRFAVNEETYERSDDLAGNNVMTTKKETRGFVKRRRKKY